MLYADLTNSIDVQKPEMLDDGFRLVNNTYTGISNPANYSTDGLATCNNWSTTTQAGARWGIAYNKAATSVSTNGTIACDFRASLYCVEQP